MYVVFDLNDDKNDKRTEYKMENIDFIPRIGEEIFLNNGIRAGCLTGIFKVESIEYNVCQSQLEENQKTGKGELKGVKVCASKK